MHRLYNVKWQGDYKWWIEKNVEGTDCDLFKVLSQHMHPKSEKYYKQPPGYEVAMWTTQPPCSA